MKIRDRSEINKKLAVRNYLPPFFSVLLPELGRPECVIRCVKHLVQYADMPFEIIIHDDGSGIQNQLRLLNELSPFVSVFVFNAGRNAGLGVALNRCRKMASSRYLLKMDVDDYITSGIMKNVKAALDLPYCGVVGFDANNVGGNPGSPGLYITPAGTRVHLARSPLSSAYVFGVTTDVWDAAGGWDENVQTTASDTGFIGNIFALGKFHLVVDGTYLNDLFLTDNGVSNNTTVNPKYVSSARFAWGDNNLPKVNGVSNGSNLFISKQRAEDIWHSTNDIRIEREKNGEVDNSWYGSGFHGQESSKLFPKDKYIDWEFAKEYGHDKYKDMIIRDFNLKEKE